jgi:hypothetical protein
VRSIILAIIGVFWGGAVLIYGLVTGIDGGGSYAGGQVAALVVAAVVVVAGSRTLVRHLRRA